MHLEKTVLPTRVHNVLAVLASTTEHCHDACQLEVSYRKSSEVTERKETAHIEVRCTPEGHHVRLLRYLRSPEMKQYSSMYVQ